MAGEEFLGGQAALAFELQLLDAQRALAGGHEDAIGGRSKHAPRPKRSRGWCGQRSPGPGRPQRSVGWR